MAWYCKGMLGGGYLPGRYNIACAQQLKALLFVCAWAGRSSLPAVHDCLASL